MALVYKEPVYAQFLKVYHAVFPLGVIQFIKFCLNCFPCFHELLDRELLPVGCLHVVNATLNVVKLTHELFPLAFLTDGDFLELRVSDNHRIISPRRNPAAEFFTVSRFKIPSGRHKDIRTRIEPQVLRCPLTDKMVRHDKHGFLA